MQPKDIFNYNFWEKLNQFYGAIHIQKELAKDMKAIIEFEPGLYNHIQMKAIRDEYVKLPGIRFGWVKGKTAVQVSTLLLQFDKRFTLRMPLKKYNYWDSLNRRYLANITVIEEDVARAHIRFRPGAYSDLELKSILSRYRRLPGIDSVGKSFPSLFGLKALLCFPKRRQLQEVLCKLGCALFSEKCNFLSEKKQFWSRHLFSYAVSSIFIVFFPMQAWIQRVSMVGIWNR